MRRTNQYSKKYFNRLDAGRLLIGAKIEKPVELDENKIILTGASFENFERLVKMKTLYLIRHAKSSWDDPSLDDFSRPLNERGERDAPRMGKRLKEREVTADVMITSPAERARKTCHIIAKVLGFPEDKIKLEKGLYHASESVFLTVLKTIKEPNDVVMIFGHNPGLTDFANSLLNESIMNIPTTGIVAGKLNVNLWSEVSLGSGELLFFDFPKKAKAE